jgi:polyhydroxyalkanoate synthesis regulator phasin
MIEFIKKAMFTGIGLASITKDKVEEVARDFIEQGNLSEKEGRKLVQEMMTYSEKSRGELESQIERYVEKLMEKLEVAQKSDIDGLRNEITILQEKIKQLEQE